MPARMPPPRMHLLMMRTALLALALMLTLVAPPRTAHAAADDPTLLAARRAYLDGVELVKKAQWSDALAAFERSAELRPHATTTFSIGACERALGRYTRARATLSRALAQSAANNNQMPAELAGDARAFLDEIDRLLAHVQIHLDPPDTEITVDGRPLELQPGGYPALLVAGVLPPGRGAPPPVADFELIAEPGTHVIMLAHRGYSNAVVHRQLEPGSRTTLPLVLAKLPATIHVASNRPSAVVSVDDVDVGPAPVDVLRSAGSYRIAVHAKGFVTYRTRATVQAGEQIDLMASLPVEKRAIYKQWWFWTGAAVLVGGIVGLTYGLTRPPPPFDGGSTGWVAH
jgi:PEGA domain